MRVYEQMMKRKNNRLEKFNKSKYSNVDQQSSIKKLYIYIYVCVCVCVFVRLLISSFTKYSSKTNNTCGHCWLSKAEPITDVILWTTTHGHTSVADQQLCADTGSSSVEPPASMKERETETERQGDRKRERERERERAKRERESENYVMSE